MEVIKGSLGNDGIERYCKIIHETLDKNNLCFGYAVSFKHDIKKDKTTLVIVKFAHGIPVKELYSKFYCDGTPILTEKSFEEEFEKHKHKFII